MNNGGLLLANIIKLVDVKKFYDNGQTKALNGINLEIDEGEFVSIIGASGSGKSTLLNMLGALDKPDSGEITVAGLNLQDKNVDLSKFRHDTIGFIFQLHNLIPNLNALENVEIPLLGNSNRVSKEDEQHAISILENVGLKDKINQQPSKMSGGQRQRVAIARALVNNPKIILADEPTGALDSKTGNMIMSQLKTLHDTQDVTLIIVTHDISIAKQADRIITVQDGQIIEDKHSI